MKEEDRVMMWLSLTISRQDAEEALAFAPTGTFVVRASVSAPGDYVLSLSIDGRVRHHQLKHNSGRMKTKSGKTINNLLDLIAHYRKECDGLEVLLTESTTAFDPPLVPPSTLLLAPAEGQEYVNAMDLGQDYVNCAMFDPAYENAGDVELLPTDGDYENSGMAELGLEGAPKAPPKAPPRATMGSDGAAMVDVGGVTQSETADYVVPDDDNDYENAIDCLPEAMAPATSLEHKLRRYELDPKRVTITRELGAGQFGQVFEAWLSGTDSMAPTAESLAQAQAQVNPVSLGEPGSTTPAAATTAGRYPMSRMDSFTLDARNVHKHHDHQQGKLVAVKSCKLKTDADTRQSFLMEAATLARFHHPNVLALLGVITVTDTLQILVEHMVYGDLRAMLRACRAGGVEVHEFEMLFMSQQISAGMEHLVSKAFVHRDLAARNILVGRYCTVKIGDFGLSRQLEDEAQYYVVHSRSLLPIKWMAPECLTMRKFTHKTDVYAFGVVLWEIFTRGKTPWRKVSTKDVTQRVKAGERLPFPETLAENVCQVMEDCWLANPDERPSFEQLRKRLEMLHSLSAGSKLPRDVGQLVYPNALTPKKYNSTNTPARRPASAAPSVHPGTPSDAVSTFSVDPSQGGSIALEEFPREDLRYIRDIGGGECDRIVLMELTDGLAGGAKRMVAAKMEGDDPADLATEAFNAELALHQSCALQHPNLVALLGVCTEDVPRLILLEYLDLGDFHSFLLSCAPSMERAAKLSTAQLCQSALEIASGCEYLESKGIVHRDIATRNCMVGSGLRIKLSNFGLGRALSKTDYYQSRGTPLPIRWMAPEAICFSKFSLQSDVWSFGVTLWEIFMFASRPYRGLTDMDLTDKISKGEPLSLSLPVSAPAIFHTICKDCMQMNPSNRPSFADLASRCNSYIQGSETIKADAKPHVSPLSFVQDIDWGRGYGEIVQAGWLTKQGGGTTVLGRQSWKRRWFVLRDTGVMTYHKTQRPDAKPLGTIDLREAFSVGVAEPFQPDFEKVGNFTVGTHSRVFYLVCEQDSEYHSWIRCLQSAVESFQQQQREYQEKHDGLSPSAAQ
eukprot:m.160285 g.160285  ORF g.160285 m.160285 type:complete len:1073 (+) comp14347_c2_seq1:610-3828(+)